MLYRFFNQMMDVRFVLYHVQSVICSLEEENTVKPGKVCDLFASSRMHGGDVVVMSHDSFLKCVCR